jgi:hypothetical protein
MYANTGNLAAILLPDLRPGGLAMRRLNHLLGHVPPIPHMFYQASWQILFYCQVLLAHIPGHRSEKAYRITGIYRSYNRTAFAETPKFATGSLGR